MAAVLACAFSLTVAPVGALAAPPSDTETVAEETDAAEEQEDAENGHTEDGTTDPAEDGGGEGAGGTEDGENTSETGAATEDEDEGAEEPETSEADADADEDGAASETKAANSVVLPAHAADPETTAADEAEAEKEDEEVSEYEDEIIPDTPTYSAPADERHVNVSFNFTETVSSSYFSELTYPLTLSLKEVDTGRKLTLTIKSEGQILEVEKGDYAVRTLKDSGKVPLTVAGDTLHMYENMEYPVRFAANNALKMFMDFLADNILLVLFFAFAALFYKAVVIPRFASDIRRR